MRISSIVASLTVLVMVAASLGVAIGNASADQGSRDTYSYRWTDSNSPTPTVAFNWVEINSTGTNTGLTDSLNYVGPMPIGFTFNFYGNPYLTFYATTSGFISFGSGSYSWSNDPIPDWSSPDNFIAPYWDYGTNYDGTIYYQTIGSAPNRQLVVEWENVSTMWAGSLLTYELILNETGDIWFQYLDVGTDYGQDASVGIEDSSGDIGTQYSYETSSLSDNLAIRFSTGPVTISPSQTGQGMMGSTVSYTLTVKNWQAWADSFGITYTSELGWAVSLYDSLGSPLTDTDGDTVPDTGSMAAGSSVDIEVTVDIPASPSAFEDLTNVTATSYADSSARDTCTLTTDVSSAWFTPPHEDVGLDPTGDGDFDTLSLNASLYVRVEGWYYINSYMHLPSEVQISTDSSSGYYTTGTHTMNLRFFGWNVYDSSTNGPYHIHMTLYDAWWIIQDTDIHTTVAYSYTDFMSRPGVFGTPHASGVDDPDLDGLYDHLFINATVVANYDWRFMVEIDLYDSSYSYMMYKQVTTTMTAGSNIVSMSFDAWDISEQGLDGWFYAYMYLYAWVDGSWVYMDSDTHTTATYTLDQFERRPIFFTTGTTDYANDTDSNGLYDYLEISVMVDVAIEGDYTITGIMRADSWAPVIDTVSNTTHLTVGVHSVNLDFPGWPIYANSDSDDMDLILEAWSASVLVDTSTYTTWDYYYYWDFETAPGWFEPPYNEYGLDENSDGLFDYLVAEIPVTVEVAGYYRVQATLDAIWDVETLSNTTYLPVGTTTVEIWFTGWLIYDNGWDGPYTIYMYLYDSENREMDYDSFFTAGYQYTDFQTHPAQFGTPNVAYVEDGDSDGDYDALFVNATVDVAIAGTYLVSGLLYDTSWNFVESGGVWVTLGTGSHVVQFSFPAWIINTHGVDGVFNIQLQLSDTGRNVLDYANIATSTYQNETFDLTVPRIVSSWTYAAPTMDGSMPAGEWAVATSISLGAADPLNSVYGTLLVMNDATNLYIAYDAFGDTTEETSDRGAIGFDTGNDDLMTDGQEDAFLLTGSSPTSSQHFAYSSASSTWTTHCSPFDTGYSDHATLAGRAGFGPSDSHAMDHRIFEFSIPLALLETTTGGVIGFLGGSWNYDGLYDGWNGTDSWWPVWRSTSPGIDQYGEIEIAVASGIIPPPVTSASVSGTAGLLGWYKSQVNVTLSAFGGDGGVNYTEYRLDSGSWTTYSAMIHIAADGTHTLEFRSVDMADQTELTKTLTVRIDTVLPVTSSSITGRSLSLTAADGTSGVSSIRYRIDSGTWTVYGAAINLATLGAGTHVIEFYATDVAGNIESMQSLAIVPPPVTTATITGTSGFMSWYKSQVNVTLSATGGSGGVNRTEYRLDGGSWTTYTAMIQITAQGSHTLEYRSVDHIDQAEATKTVVVRIDTEAPTSTFASSGSWFWLNGTDTTSGLSSIRYRIDGGAWTTYTRKVNITEIGTHVVEYFAIDTAGNEENAKSVTVKVKEPGSGLGISSGTMVIIGLIGAAVAAALILLVLLMRRRKGQAPTTYPQVQAEMMPPPPPQ